MKMKSLKAAKTVFVIVVLTLASLCSLLPIAQAQTPDQIWPVSGVLPTGDVDWDGNPENVRLVINDGTKYDYTGAPTTFDRGDYLWRAPFVIADQVPNGRMGIENLRERVYWKGVRRLDEGWWDETGNKQGYLYQIKTTGAGPHTWWSYGWTGTEGGTEYDKIVQLLRDVHYEIFTVGTEQFQAFLVEYQIWFAHGPRGDPWQRLWLAGHFGFGIIWHAGPNAGNAETSLNAMVEAMATFQTTYASDFPGIIDQDLKFELSYFFDDNMKEWSNRLLPNVCLIGWDGENVCIFRRDAHIDYEDDDYSPTNPIGVQPSAAIFGMVHVPARIRWVDVEMDNSFINSDGAFVGVGPTGNEFQRVYITHSPSLFTTGWPDLNGDGKIDIMDIAIAAKHYGEVLEP